MTSDRDYDLVLLGATGFTGRLVAEHLSRHAGDQPWRWAIAGRSADKLAAVREELVAAAPNGAPDATEKVDVADLVGLLDLCQRTRVVATTVGPYARLGELVVQACVRSGTDYVDITGEPAFVTTMLRRYDADARRRGVRIVNCCGFDSIPPDLGAQLAVEQLPGDAPIRMRGFVSGRGSFSGGTATSALEALGDPSSVQAWRPDPAPGRTVGALPRRIARVGAIDGWAVPLPTIDPQIVLRSAAALDRYGPEFRYGHYLRAGSAPVAAGMVGGVASFAALAQVGPGRALLERLLPDSGSGPDEEARAAARFRVTLLGDGSGQHTRVEVRGGDPGYTETSKMLGEAARCLIEERDRLPDVAGVLTPAVAFGAVLRERLRAHGIAFDVVNGA